MSITLAAAIVALVTWFALIVVMHVASGMPHVLLAVGVTLLVRWWATRT